jgi:hypothetical protein
MHPLAPAERLSVRTLADNPDHHLWNNNGTWWCHYTIHRADHTKQRVRRSLSTRDLREARRQRDTILRALTTGGKEVG